MESTLGNQLKLAAIVIPLYKKKPNEYEKLAYIQCTKVLWKYDILLAVPEGFDSSVYLQCADNVRIREFPSCYFEGIKGYNNLLLSVLFYERFLDYEYILIYQLDCFVFRDELEFWCSKNYDYIGAPWIRQNIYKDWLCRTSLYPKELVCMHAVLFGGKLLSKVGNGGLSLRRIGNTIKNLKLFKGTAVKWRGNEDSFYSHYVKTFNPFFKIADFKEALKFSFDSDPETAYEMNGLKLPFACHGWYRNDAPHYINNLRFWKLFIEYPDDK